MQSALLYAACVLIWGSTWLAIKLQLGVVPPEWSLVYRFAIASAGLFAFALVARRSLRLPLADQPYVALQGLLLFCLNYLFVYYGSESLPSGVVAVLFTALLFANIVNERFFFSAPVSARVVLGAVCGVTGIALVFWPEISQLTLGDEAVAGAALVVAGALTASLGNMAAIRNTRTGAQVITLNAWAMAWGTAILVAAALVRGEPPAFEWTTAYVGSLLFLALPGTAIAFGFYLALIRRIGASRAAYSNVLLPVVALGLSTVFEGYRWTLLAAAGVALTLVGNALALSRRPAAPARG